ncbi:MAG: ABC transporter permease subunit/CPBP intramembrane protease [Planctomycetaceae bacterium]
MSPDGPAAADRFAPDPHERLPRLARLALKELREILRDRRTIVTLVLMPLLLYPLLTIVFQQFFMSQLGHVEHPRYTLGFSDSDQGHFFVALLSLGGLKTVDIHAPAPVENSSEPVVETGVRHELEAGLEEYDIDVALRLKGPPPQSDDQSDVALDVELLYRDDSLHSRQAADYIEKYLVAAGKRLLEKRLRALRVTQRVEPVSVVRLNRAADEGVGGAVSMTAVIPFVLILMTVTGAVYPAIDLTAGERERGTLEILVAAPIPRIGVLFAKYVAVLTVALLTAAANMLTMTVTMSVSGMGKLLFGEGGLSLGVIAAVFGLLLLFAAFFSAVLLVITSCARSFKEAQAYLIPLILVSLAPGMVSLLPGLKLSGLLLVTPLANMVLLGRDLLELRATGFTALTVVVSTLVYAAAAIALAARVFGSESVLYSDQPGWSDLFRRPRESQPVASVTAATVCLAVMFPAYFILVNLLGGAESIDRKLLGGMVMTVLVFGALPGFACWMRRVSLPRVFALPRQPTLAFAGALLAGLSVWTLAHEVVVLGKTWRGVSFDPAYLEEVQKFAEQLRLVPVGLSLIALAVVPAVFEEAFFRGYMYGALDKATTAPTAILLSAAAFGLFHAVIPNPLASERLLSSTLIGLVLGWVRWRSGSVLPGMVLHLCHNALLVLLGHYQPELASRGIGVTDGDHLPPLWTILGGLTAAAGLGLVWWSGRRSKPAAGRI